MENTRMPLRELIDTAKDRLRELRYAPATINAFSRYWRELLEYAEKAQTQYFSVTLGEDYLRDVCSTYILIMSEACPAVFQGAGDVRQGANRIRMLLIVSRSSPSSCTRSFMSNATCFLLRVLRWR